MESYLDIMLEFTELWSATHSRLHVWFHTPVAIEVIGTPEQDLDGWFVSIVHFLKWLIFSV